MRLSIVRCPYCDRRYNVTGIPSGTKVLCTSCDAVLTVPQSTLVQREPLWRRLLPRSPIAQLPAAMVVGLVLAWLGYVALQGPQEIRPEGPKLPRVPDEVAKAVTFESGSSLAIVPPDLHPAQFSNRSAAPFMLFVEKHPDLEPSTVFDSYEPLLQKLYGAFMEEFGDPLKLDRIGVLLPIVLYTSRESYEAWWRRAFGKSPGKVPGVYSYDMHRVGMYFDRSAGEPSVASIETLLHEAIHLIFYHYYRDRVKERRRQPWWFQEGLGSYFEGVRKDHTGTFIPDPKMTTSRLDAVKAFVRDESTFISLRWLMARTVEEMWSEWDRVKRPRDRWWAMLEVGYAESWALVYFLCNGGHRELFHEYMKLELSGLGSRDAFIDLLRKHRDLDIEDLEKEFKKYIESL